MTTTPEARAAALLGEMTLEQKAAQIVGFWLSEAGDIVAPMQDQHVQAHTIDEAYAHGLGHLTRVYGTDPVDPTERRDWLRDLQRGIAAASGHGIPALVHEECLTGLAAWKAATFPTPLAWGAAHDPSAVERMGALIGESMRSLGIHQGLAPVLDVIRDPRWGRVDECIGEDPHLVGDIATAYVRGLQSAGVDATLKHFVGYSASAAGRNFGPVSMGRRELEDVMMPPFEMAVKDGGVHSVMHAYTDIDGVPSAANAGLLTGVLRDRWGFDGVVVSDYFGIANLQALNGIARDRAEAAGLALAAGVDVELPTGDAYGEPLLAAIRAGDVDEALLDRAALRALTQKARLGLIDGGDAVPETTIDLDSAAHRAIARELAEKSVVLLSNDGTLPLAAGPAAPNVAVVGPNGDRPEALFGCYSFANHVLANRPGVPLGLDVPTLAESLRAALGQDVAFERGCDVRSTDASGIPAAVDAARGADVVVAAVGDHAGLFGGGSVGEGCDVESLEIPGAQRSLVEALLESGTPVVLVVLSGRPYAIDWALDRCAAVIQSFFPGEEGGGALARVLTGAVNPSGKLPITMPRAAGAQPYTYLHSALAGPTDTTSLDPTPVRPFGYGLSYTTFDVSLEAPTAAPCGASIRATATVTNTGERAGRAVLPLFARVPHASVPRPVAKYVASAAVELAPGASATVEFAVPTTRLAFSDVDYQRVVEPGEVELWVGDAATREAEARTALTGDTWAVPEDAPLGATVTVDGEAGR